jgi:hypothetical protein
MVYWTLHHHQPSPAAGLSATVYRHHRHHRHRRDTVSTATLSWTNPTTRTDNSQLDPADIASIDIFDDDSATPAVAIGNVAGGTTTTFTTGVLSVGPHSFTVVVNDTAGHVSAPSNAAAVTVQATMPPPSPATGLAATLNP